MARFKEQNVDIIIEKDAFSIFLKDLRDEFNMSKVFVIATSSLDQDKLNHVIDNARFGNAVMYVDSFVDPSEESVNQAIEAFKQSEADTIIGIGGGSVIDLAKAVVYFNLTNRPNLILVPTTYAGTELTKGFMIVRPDHTKKSVFQYCVLPTRLSFFTGQSSKIFIKALSPKSYLPRILSIKIRMIKLLAMP